MDKYAIWVILVALFSVWYFVTGRVAYAEQTEELSKIVKQHIIKQNFYN